MVGANYIMRFRKHSKDKYTSEELLQRAYKTKELFELQRLLKQIERLINLSGSDKSLNRAKSVVTTKIIVSS